MRNLSQVVSLIEEMAAKKRSKGWRATIIMGLMAGVFIAMGGLLSMLVSRGFPPELLQRYPSISSILAGAVFPLGIILVVMFGAELFTGNNAHLMTSALRGRNSWGFTLTHWAAIWALNLLGALFFVYFFVYLTGLLDGTYLGRAACQIAYHKVEQPFWTIFLKGIGANWLVCLAVWLSFYTDSLVGKVIALWWPIMAFVVMGFEHSVANMYYLPLGILAGANISPWDALMDNLIPATLGNMVGGAIFVGLFLTLATEQGVRQKPSI